MQKNEILSIVTEELADVNKFFSAEEIKSEFSLSDDLGLDSLDFIELIMALEQRLKIGIPDDCVNEPLNTYTVDRIVEVVYACMLNQTVE